MKTSYEIRMGGVTFGRADSLEKAEEMKAKMEEVMIGTAVIVETYNGREILDVKGSSTWEGSIDA